MFNPKKFERFACYLHESIPKVIHDITYNIDEAIRKKIQEHIHRMNLVNRDEFDFQTKILLETQEQLKQLEIRLQILESVYNSKCNQKHN